MKKGDKMKKKTITDILNQLEAFSKKPVGIFGDAGAGKTVYFTVLYHQKASENGEVRLTNSDFENQELNKSELYLRENYLKYLSRGQNIPSTGIDNEKKLQLNYSYRNIEYQMVTYDYSGELTKNRMDKEIEEREVNSEDIFRKVEFEKKQSELYDFFKKCKSIMIFLEFTEDVARKEQIVQNISDLLNAIEKNKKINNKTGSSIPIAIIITKCDHHSPVDSEFVSQLEKVKKTLEEDPQYKKILNQVKNFASKELEIFPISSFGGSKRSELGEELPPESINPKFIFKPLIWFSNMYDQFYMSEIECILDYSISAKELTLIKEFVNHNIGDNDIKGKLLEEIEKKRKTKRKKRNLITITTTIIFILLLGISLKVIGNNKYNKLEKDYINSVDIYEKSIIMNNIEEDFLLEITNSKRINDLKKNYDNLKEQQKKITFKIIENMDSLSLRKKAIEDFLYIFGTETEYQVALSKIKEDIFNEEVKQKYQIILNLKDSKSKKEEIEAFINEFPDHYLSINLKNELIRIESKLDVDQAYFNLMDTIQYIDSDYSKYQEIKNFLSRYHDIDNYEEVNAQAESYLLKAEKKLYEEIKIAEQRQDRELMRELVDRYLYTNDFKDYINEVKLINSKINFMNEQDMVNKINENVHIYNDLLYQNSSNIESIKNQIDLIINLCKDYSEKGFSSKSWIEKTYLKAQEIKNSIADVILDVIIYGQYGLGIANNSFKIILKCDSQNVTLKKSLNTKVPASVGTINMNISPWSNFEIEIYRDPFGPFIGESLKDRVTFNFADLNTYKNFIDNEESRQIKLEINKSLFEIPVNNGY